MKRSKEELIKIVRDHGGDTPDDFTISVLEDLADSMDESTATPEEIEALKAEKETAQNAAAEAVAQLNALRKVYADRFVISDKPGEESTPGEEKEEEETTETYASLYD